MLLHGLACSLAYWLRVVPRLSGVRVVALDVELEAPELVAGRILEMRFSSKH